MRVPAWAVRPTRWQAPAGRHPYRWDVPVAQRPYRWTAPHGYPPFGEPVRRAGPVLQGRVLAPGAVIRPLRLFR